MLLQAGGGMQPFGAVLGILGRLVAEDRRIIIEEAGVVVLHVFGSHDERGPSLRQLFVVLVVRAGVELPQGAGPETAGPEITFLLLPLAGGIVAIGEKPAAHELGYRARSIGIDERFETGGGAICARAQQRDRLRPGAMTGGDERIGRGALRRGGFR